jgi:hypothetical protein
MNQFALYLEAKERHPGMLLMFRDQDDYLIVGADVDIAAKVIDFEAIATRCDGFKIGEFESEALETNLRKLLKAGHRVAICDQIEPAALPKRVEVNRNVTGGCRATVETPDPDDLPDPAWCVQPSFLPGDPGDLDCGRQRTLFDLGEKMPLSQPDRADQPELF